MGTAGPLRGDLRSGAGKAKLFKHVIEICTLVGNTRGPAYTESLLLSLREAMRQHDVVTLNMESNDGSVRLAADLSAHLRSYFLHEFQDAYPGTTARKITARTAESTKYKFAIGLRPDVLPIRDFDEFRDSVDQRFTDPMAGLLAALRTGPSGRLNCSLALELRRPTPRRFRSAERTAVRLLRGFRSRRLRKLYILTTAHPRTAVRLFGRAIGVMAKRSMGTDTKAKTREPIFECFLTVRIETNAPEQIAKRRYREILAALARFNKEASFVEQKHDHRRRRGFVLTAREIATLWHPLTAPGDAVSRMQRSTFREIEPPVLTSKKESFGQTVLGRACYREQRNTAPVESPAWPHARALFRISSDEISQREELEKAAVEEEWSVLRLWEESKKVRGGLTKAVGGSRAIEGCGLFCHGIIESIGL